MEPAAPLVSIVIATYNWSSVLHYALRSVQAQTFTDFEVLVIGDGCTDDSADVVAAFCDLRFHWENLPFNHGHQSAANNRGIERARGKWIAYLGHDDLWLPEHLSLLLGKLAETNGDLAFSLAMVLGAPGCDGRRLFGAFEHGQFTRGSHLPPSALLHRKSLIETCGKWPDHRQTRISPETDLLARFCDHGAIFVSIPEVTVFKFPSSWRLASYVTRSCAEQADFFQRMQHDPAFLHRELIELGIAQELLKPHTKVLVATPEDARQPGAIVEGFRRNRGLTAQAPREGPPRFVGGPAWKRLINRRAVELIRRQQAEKFARFQVCYPVQGQYPGPLRSRTLLAIGRWTRVRVALEHACADGPLRLDPCDQPLLVEIAGLLLRRGAQVEWSLRGAALQKLQLGGDAFRVETKRVLTLRSRGNDPQIFLPRDVAAGPPQMLHCWLRLSRA